MNCTVCQSKMICDEPVVIWNIFYDFKRYHCLNAACPAKIELNYISHISILESNWLNGSVMYCHEYHLPFLYHDKWYLLIGQQTSFTATVLRTSNDPKPLIFMDYVSIDMNNMYNDSFKLFKRLINLTAFV